MKNTEQIQINFVTSVFTIEHDSLAQAAIGVLGLLFHSCPCLRDTLEDKAKKVRWNPILIGLVFSVTLCFKNQIHHSTTFLVFICKARTTTEVSTACAQFMFSRQAGVTLPTELKQQHWGVQTLSKGLHRISPDSLVCSCQVPVLTWPLFRGLPEALQLPPDAAAGFLHCSVKPRTRRNSV